MMENPVCQLSFLLIGFNASCSLVSQFVFCFRFQLAKSSDGSTIASTGNLGRHQVFLFKLIFFFYIPHRSAFFSSLFFLTNKES